MLESLFNKVAGLIFHKTPPVAGDVIDLSFTTEQDGMLTL